MENEIRQALANHIILVEFEKKDRSIRKMYCHRIFNKIPEDQRPMGLKTPGIGQIPVFDVGKQEWRSFRVDSVISWRII
jgi:hypothetical protein